MSDVKETFVYQKKVCDGEYLAIKHHQTRVGWDWRWSYVTRLQEAWQGALPCNPLLIDGDSNGRLNSNDFDHVHIRVTTTVNFELIPQEATDG